MLWIDTLGMLFLIPSNQRKVFAMQPTPQYFKPGKKINNSQFFRNYWCTDYEQCLDRAAFEDLFLDCTQCQQKNDIIDTFALFLKSKPPT
jgi:hypothetical protein